MLKNQLVVQVNKRPKWLSFIFIIFLLVVSSIGTASAAPGTIWRLSANSEGVGGNGTSNEPDISADGRYVVFWSSANNLVADDTNGTHDVFLHDRYGHTLTRISVDSDGNELNESSYSPSISNDGRLIAFGSRANNLVVGDNNNKGDIFVFDQATGEMTLVSVDSNGNQANDDSHDPAISGDGRFIAFLSEASNLVEGDTNNRTDIFVHDRESGATTRVSVASDGTEANTGSQPPAISADGRYVTFGSGASTLVANDTNGWLDVFVHDRQTGETTRISTANDGRQANHHSGDPDISADGQFIVFASRARNLVDNDSEGQNDVFIYDQTSGQIARLTELPDGTAADGDSYQAAISGDGRYVTFSSEADNLTTDDIRGYGIFVFDRKTGVFTLASRDSDGTPAEDINELPVISDYGRFITFESTADNLLADGNNDNTDIYLVELFPLTSEQCTVTGYTFPYTVGTVNSGDHAADLRQALACANRDSSDSKTITLADNIVLTAVDNESVGNNGLPVISSTIIIEGAGYTIERDSSYTSCDGSFADFRFFSVASNGSLLLQDVGLQNGCAAGEAPNNRGGAIHNMGITAVVNSTFANHTSTGRAGAIYNTNELTVQDSSFVNNSTVAWGGAILNGNSGIATITGSTFTQNMAQHGGALFNNNRLNILNSTIHGNGATGHGGGIYSAQNDQLSVAYSTIVANGQEGIYNNQGSLKLVASLLADNAEGDCSTSGVAAGYHNLIEDGSSACGFVDGSDGNLIGVDPMLLSLADNGGGIATVALQAGSPAIDAGASDCPATDQRGVARPQGAACDIGALEMLD